MMAMEPFYRLELAVLLLIYYSLVSVVIAEPVDEKVISNQTRNEEISLLFKQYVIRHNKTYLNDPNEYYKRQEIFKQSLARQFKLNQRGKELNGSAVYGVNKFSDWTLQEFKEFLRMGYRKPSQIIAMNTNSECLAEAPNLQLPPHWDWKISGKVTAVKNQGKCGSCWAFTAVENIESQWAIKHGTLKELSVQELISCGAGSGCSGGNTCNALKWLKDHDYTVAPESEFPYQDKETTCIDKAKHSKEGVRISEYCCYETANETNFMQPIVAFIGPMAVNVDATLWHDYLGGIIQYHCTDTDINHAVQITGYDETGEVPYWIVRNSWGADFGDKGYLYIKIGKNLCGLAGDPSYVTVP
ncbi:cathepsin O-like [Actinia tenebrosa]|uniref:Cathepsin O-like n=1 Tax=Actinia tenebrosa TaxID=6105 RepID=A0A6P8IYM5_ACTTE|nr:cathepsin O-like [Actinia tenebrosa]